MGSEQNRFPQQQERRKKWAGCWGGLPCFRPQKGGKRIVPASRAPEGNGSANQSNGPQAVGLTNPPTSLHPSLLAPPSSPASFSNSALPSTAQSPSCHLSLSANSPGGPSSTMYATGPYAHETQLVSPPVFSTFTTEPSTAPYTPPPELAHLTTPSSPDVPYAQFLSSSLNLKTAGRTANDLQNTYSYSPGSPASTLISPASRNSGNCISSSFPDREFPSKWDAPVPSQTTRYPMSGSGSLNCNSMPRDTNFFCPATFAQFYLDQPFSHSGGRLSISKDSDAHSNGGNGIQNRQNKNCSKQDVEELEAYRASFGFSADEIITTAHYVEISDVMDDSFTMMPHLSGKPHKEQSEFAEREQDGPKTFTSETKSLGENNKSLSSGLDGDKAAFHSVMSLGSRSAGKNAYDYDHDNNQRQPDDTSANHVTDVEEEEEDVLSNMGKSVPKRKYDIGLSYSDAEVEYRRGRSLREGRGNYARHL